MKIGINGFGRIGKNVVKALIERHPHLSIGAVNDLGSPEELAHLFAFDSTYGAWHEPVQAKGDELCIGSRQMKIFAEREPQKIPWHKACCDVVLECTGRFVDATQARAHIDGGGARKVIISAPAKGEDLTVVMGVNDGAYDSDKHHVLSNASCTTNCLATATKPLVDAFGWRRGFMTTVHAYTNDQNVLDAPHKDLRRARAAAINIIPTSSGAAKALYLTIPEVKGSFDGFALRVPVQTVSMCYLVAELNAAVSREQLNDVLKSASEKGPLKDILAVSEAPLVSSDLRRSPYSSTIDMGLTQAQGELVQICAWYDNEWGYACRLADLAAKIAAN